MRVILSVMTPLWLLIGLALGAGAVLIALRPRMHGLSREAARAAELERELVRAQTELIHERASAQAELAHERRSARNGWRTLTDAQERLSDSFKALSAEALQSSMAQLAEMARAQLQAAQARPRAIWTSAERGRAAGRSDQGAARAVDAQLLRLDQERRESRGGLEAQLRTLTETGEGCAPRPARWSPRCASRTRAVSGVRCSCATWSSWPAWFATATSPSSPRCRRRRDAAPRPGRRLPGGKHVVVDAKAPLQGVLDAYEARDEDERERHLRDHARLLRKHVKLLADKAYWAQLESAPDFVVLFLPGEHLYGAALEVDPALIEDAMARRVLIATPTTLLAMLRAVGYGWQQERVAESAQAISELGRELHGRLVKLSGMLSTLGKRLNSTVAAYNEARLARMRRACCPVPGASLSMVPSRRVARSRSSSRSPWPPAA